MASTANSGSAPQPRRQPRPDFSTHPRRNFTYQDDDPYPFNVKPQRPAFGRQMTTRSLPSPRKRAVDLEKGEESAEAAANTDVAVKGHRDARRKKRERSELTYDIAAMLAEFIGTFMFLWLAFTGAQSASYNRGGTGSEDSGVTTTDNNTILFIALSFGMSLIVTAWVFFRITGAAFNPAVTLSLWLVGNLTTLRAALIIVAQLVGGICAAAVSKGLTLSNFGVANTLVNGLSIGKGLAIEFFTTAMLVFTVLMMAAEKHKSTFLAPVCIGLSLFVGHLASVGWTGAGMNPARTLGPSVVNASFPHYAWIYYVGQLLGALLATIIYVVLKHLDYQKIVENVDTEDVDESQAIHEAPIAQPFAQLGVTLGADASEVEATKAAAAIDVEQRELGSELSENPELHQVHSSRSVVYNREMSPLSSP